jgi:hypothetical protein
MLCVCLFAAGTHRHSDIPQQHVEWKGWAAVALSLMGRSAVALSLMGRSAVAVINGTVCCGTH